MQNGGSCFLPKRMADPLIALGKLALIPDSLEFNLPAYAVYPDNIDTEVHQQAIQILHDLINYK